MKNILLFFFIAFILANQVSFAEEAPPIPPTTIQKQATPDFSPPKDLTGPVFPPEEILGKPGPDTDRFLSEFLNMLATLGLLIALILFIAWFLKRMVNSRQEQANTTSLIKILERRSLSPKSAVYLLEVEGKSLIIAESQNGVTRLSEYDSPPEESEEPKVPSTFKKLLDQ